MVVSKKQVLCLLTVYAVTRGVLDELKPAEEATAASDAFDQVAFDASMEAIDSKVIAEKGAK